MAIQYIDQNADLVGTVAGTFNITAGSNDTLAITIDGGSVQNFTLTAGAARTAAQVAADINATLTSGTAYATSGGCDKPNRVRIRTASANGATSTILIGAPSNNANATLGFTAATYTGYSRRKTSWAQTTGTKQELADKIETELNAVGWATISGSGTNDLLMESPMSPPGQDLVMRVRIKGTNTNCVSINIQAISGSPAGANGTNNGGQLLPAAAKDWIFVSCKYHAFIFVPQNAATLPRGYCAFGLLNIPTHMQGVTTQAFWLSANARNDTDSGSDRLCLRNNFSPGNYGSGIGNYQIIYNGSLQDSGNASLNDNRGSLQILPFQQVAAIIGGYTWKDGSSFLYDCWVIWGDASSTLCYVRGQLWDGFLTGELFTADTTYTLPSPDSHNVMAVGVAGGTASSGARGAIFVAIP